MVVNHRKRIMHTALHGNIMLVIKCKEQRRALFELRCWKGAIHLTRLRVAGWWMFGEAGWGRK